MDKYALVLTSEANSYSTARQFRLSDAIGRPHCARYTYCYAGSRIIRIAKAVFTSRPITYIPSANQSRFIAARITPTAANTSMPRKIFIMATTRTPCHARNRTSGEEMPNASHSDWPALPVTYHDNDQRNPDRQHEDCHPGHKDLPSLIG
jgi:hypothetical protein